MGSAHLATPGGILMKVNWRRRELILAMYDFGRL